MSAYTSLKLTRGRAMELVYDYLKDITDDQLRALASEILEKRGTLYNCYAIVERGEGNDDDEISHV